LLTGEQFAKFFPEKNFEFLKSDSSIFFSILYFPKKIPEKNFENFKIELFYFPI